MFAGCHNGGHNEAHFAKNPSIKVRDKITLYCEKSRAEFKARKWAVDECEGGLLYTALRGIACDDVDLSVFESTVEPGQWYRNPAKDCFIPDQIMSEAQVSDSTIDNNMYIGLALYLVHKKDAEALRRTIEYGKAHDWIVGEAKDNETLQSQCVIPPGTQGLLTDSFNYAGSVLTDVSPTDNNPIGTHTDDSAHLDVLTILLSGKVHKHINDTELEVLKDQVKRQPNNALFQAVKARFLDGDYSKATALLLDESHFPETKLPNSHDNQCNHYLYRRDETPGEWGPCPKKPNVTHDGTDFIFAAAIVEGYF